MYNISFLSDYIKLSYLTKEELSKIINIDILSIDDYLNGNLLIDEAKLINLLDYFKNDSFARFKSCIVRKIKSEKDKKYDLSFFGDYLTENKISILNFSKSTNISKDNISKISKGIIKANDEQLNKILLVFNVSSIEKLKEVINNNVIPDPIRKISKLYKYKNSVDDIYSISKNISDYNFSKYEIKNIDTIRMINVINNINMSEYDRRIAFILFFYENNYNERLEMISKIFQVNKAYIKRIKNNCMNEYEKSSINQEKMQYIVSNIGLDEKDKRIAYLLFLTKESKYTIYVVSNLTNVSFDYVYNIKKYCLDEYYQYTSVYEYKKTN